VGKTTESTGVLAVRQCDVQMNRNYSYKYSTPF